MKQPVFDNVEFVDQNIFNTAVGQLIDSAREYGSNSVYFLPGLVRPDALTFTTNGTLTISLNAPIPFKCLFSTGAFCAAHGTTTGVDSSIYSLDFTPFVPSVGSRTVYIEALQTSVNELPTTIIGPPPGHPDYAPSFVPYVGYTEQLDSLNIIPTTTVPDTVPSFVKLELARVILTPGQTSIIPAQIDTSHQIISGVYVNPNLVFLGGDVQGFLNNTELIAIAGNLVVAGHPTTGQVLEYNGTSWVNTSPPTTLPPDGPAGGDLAGTYPDPSVVQWYGVPLAYPSFSTPSDGQVPRYSGLTSSWQLSNLSSMPGALNLLGTNGGTTTQFTISADLVYLRNSTTEAIVTTTAFNAGITVDVGQTQTVSQINRRDQAAPFTANTFFNIFAISGNNPPIGLIASTRAPSMGPIFPTGSQPYLDFVYLCTVYWDGANIVPMFLQGNEMFYVTPFQVLGTGGITLPGVAPAGGVGGDTNEHPLSLTAGLPSLASKAKILIQSAADISARNRVYIKLITGVPFYFAQASPSQSNMYELAVPNRALIYQNDNAGGTAAVFVGSFTMPNGSF